MGLSVKSENLPRLLFIISRADIGGETQQLYDLCLGLKEQYPDVFFAIAAPNEAPYAERYKKLTPYIIEIPKKKFRLLSLFKLWYFCRKEKITLIHSHAREAGTYSRLLALCGYKVVHTFHGIHIRYNLPGILKLLLGRILAPLMKRAICVSLDEKEKVLKSKLAYPSQIAVINNGIDLKKIDERCQRRNLDGTFILGTLARFDLHKGIDLELKTLAHFFTIYPQSKIKVLIAGGGDEWEKIKKLHEELKLGNKVELLGPTHQPLEFLSQLDCYVSFSRAEGLPLAVLEAMAFSLPCLLSNVTGHRVLVDKKCGYLFDLENEHEFISQLLAIQENRIVATEIGKASRKKIETQFTKEKMLKETYNLYIKMSLDSL